MKDPDASENRSSGTERKSCMNRRRPKVGEIYRHFRGKKYQVLHLALCTETKEDMVIYRALEGEQRVYVSRIDKFLLPVDKGKFPDADQEYRFELCRDTEEEQRRSGQGKDTTGLIMEFLDLDDNESRAEFLQRHRPDITERFLTVASESLEFAENAETLEERYAALLKFLRTKMKYESRRLRQ